MSRLRVIIWVLPLAVCLWATAAFGQQTKTQTVAFTPLTLSLAADPVVVTTCTGDSAPAIVRLTAKGTVTIGNPVRYSWRASGGQIDGDGPTATWNLAGLTPGYYTASLEITNGTSKEECQAFSTTTVLLKCLPPVCPNVSIVCPDRVRADEPITFSANMTGGSGNVAETYNWTVSAGRIIEGQGTTSIKVDTRGLAGETIKANFSVSGYPQDCSALCLVQIPLPKTTCGKFDEFSDIQRNDEKARLDNFAVELQNDPASTGYVFAYPDKRGAAAEARERTSRIVDYLVNSRKLSVQRIVTIVGSPGDDLKVELWLCPQGLTPPK